MKPVCVTKIVALCLSVSLALVACANKIDPSENKGEPAAGVESKMGQDLLRQSWCSETHTSQDNKISVDQFNFRRHGELIITQMQLQADGSLKPTLEDVGTWGLINNQLFLRQGHETRGFNVIPSEREFDGALCLVISANGATKMLCPCSP